MNTPIISDEEQAAAFLAWKRGEPVEFSYNGGWEDAHPGGMLSRGTTIRRKPAPKLRAWRPEEVPPDALVRKTVYDGIYFSKILGVDHAGFQVVTVNNAIETRCYATALREMEHSTDGGKNWSPCGCEESP